MDLLKKVLEVVKGKLWDNDIDYKIKEQQYSTIFQFLYTEGQIEVSEGDVGIIYVNVSDGRIHIFNNVGLEDFSPFLGKLPENQFEQLFDKQLLELDEYLDEKGRTTN